MKRQLALLMVFITLLALLCTLPVAGAQDASFATLEYVCDAAEDETAERGVVSDDIRFRKAVTISCKSAEGVLYVDGKKIEEGSVYLELAGHYSVQVVKQDEPSQKYIYDVYVLPFVNAEEGQVFTEYPIIECSNALSMTLDGKAFASGDRVTTFGKHTINFFGKGSTPITMSFYVKLCHAERVFDEASGKEALKVSVGDFEGAVVTLDGTQELESGTHIVTAVGQHTVNATLNGEEVTDSDLLPGASQLLHQVRLHLSSLESKEPIFLELSRYDADFYLDGKRVKGDCRIGADGTHILEVRDADGNVMEDIFVVLNDEDINGTVYTSLELTFENPHHFYVIFLIVPACLLIAAAAYFLVIRRRIV